MGRASFELRRERLLTVIDDAIRGLRGVNFVEFEGDRLKQYMLTGCLMVIGEYLHANAGHASPELSRSLKELRNLLAHRYFDIAPQRMWDAFLKLPELREEVLVRDEPLDRPRDRARSPSGRNHDDGQ